MLKKIISIVTCLSLITAIGAFGDVANKTVSAAGGSAASHWEVFGGVTAAMRAAGYGPGGGGQQVKLVVSGESDPNIVFAGTDVAGFYRSKDGGVNWETVVGNGMWYNTVAGIGIDPLNSSRVLSVGTGGKTWSYMCLSTNCGDTWIPVMSTNDIKTAYNYRTNQFAYDKTSFDPSLGYCTVVYWSKNDGSIGEGGSTPPAVTGLYKSTDGGVTWALLPNSAELGCSRLEVHPTDGTVFAANPRGFYRSTNGGASFTKILTGDFRSLDISAAAPDTVIIGNNGGQLYKSTNKGQSFSNLYKFTCTSMTNLTISPGNAQKMIVDIENSSNDNNGKSGHKSMYSTNSGASWAQTAYDTTNAYLTMEPRLYSYAWSGTDGNAIVSYYGDSIFRSTDSGATFKYSANGVSGNWGHRISFNVNDPNLVFTSSFDYNPSVSYDGGNNWINLTKCNWLEQTWDWPGWNCTNAGYVVDQNTIVVMNVPESDGFSYQEHCYVIRVSNDGGKTWSLKTNTQTHDHYVQGVSYYLDARTYGMPGNNNIVFAGRYRSADKGATWTQMNGCDTVLGNIGTTLYGIASGSSGKTLCQSTDKGVTWSNYYTFSDSIRDIAFDAVNKLAYVVYDKYGSGLYKFDITGKTVADLSSRLVRDWDGSLNGQTVALDPNNPGTVYFGTEFWYDKVHDAAVQRSTDGGNTFKVITTSDRLGTNFGPRVTDVRFMRVNPATGELFAMCRMMGRYKFVPGVDPPVTKPSYTPKIVTLQWVDAVNHTQVGGVYLKVPDGVTIYNGDTIVIPGGSFRFNNINYSLLYWNLTGDWNSGPLNFNSDKSFVAYAGLPIYSLNFWSGSAVADSVQKLAEIKVLPPPNPRLKGDVNNDGAVNASDIVILNQALLGLTKLSGDDFFAADMDGNGSLSATDLLNLRQKVLGISQ